MVEVGGYVFAWDGQPYSSGKYDKDCLEGLHWWDDKKPCLIKTCDIPGGEPTGENIIPAIPEKGFKYSMLTLKQMLCMAIKAADYDKQQNINDEISRLREFWRQLRSEEKWAFLKRAGEYPGTIIGGVLKPILVTGGIITFIGVTALVVLTKTSALRESTKAVTSVYPPTAAIKKFGGSE